MKYIFEQHADSGITYYCVQDEKVMEKSSKPIRLQVPKLMLNGFSVSSGNIFACFFSEDAEFMEVGAKAARLLAEEGMTSMVTAAQANYHHEVERSLKKMKHKLNNAAVDYTVGISVDCITLTPEFVKECNRQHVPFIVFKARNKEELFSMPWEWLREANYLFKLVFVPDFSDAVSEKARKSLTKQWQTFASEKNIPFWQELADESLVPDVFVKKIGLYPVKGALVSGSDADYTIWSSNGSDVVVEAAVIRGSVVYVRSSSWLKKGSGKEVHIKLTGRFGLGCPPRV